ncbi:MAG: hypothetical protein KKE94_08120 [Gammaproteobacteria bacterium]|nr:hypothetical protein [Gammaproteobacteria bacterium]
MTLEEFLLTADADHVVALQQARDYAEIQPIFITSNTLTVYVLQAELYDVFADAAADSASPVRGICMALMDRLRGQSEFNLSPSLPLGQANIQMLDILISALPDKSAALTQLKDTLLAASNKTVYPLAGTTLHDVLILRDSCPTVSVTAQGGYVAITTTADCETHNPRLMALNPRTGKWQRVNNVIGVGLAGTYDVAVPQQFAGWQLAVDNAYGVI